MPAILTEPEVAHNAAAAMVADGLARIPEAMEFLALSRSVIYDLMNQGRLAFVKIGKARRIPHKAMVDFAAENLSSAQ
jgi:excisionase family DNA binding protein